MKFDINAIIEKFKYDPNSVKRNYDGRTDIYLAKASYRFAYFKRILFVLLVVVLVMFLLSGSLSYEKMFYLTKDIKLSSDYVNSVHDTITYNAGNSQVFASYRGGLAVASRERLSIFSAGGRELFSSNHSYGNPALAVSNKQVLLYDIGGKQFSLYNSFSKVKEEKLDYSIYGADMAENGDFAIITKSEKYDSVIKVYKQSGKSYTYSFSSGRVSSVALSDNGKQLVVLLSHSGGSEINTEIRLYSVGKDDFKSESISFSGVPYAVEFLDGSIFVVGSRGVNVFSSNLNLTGEYLSESEIYLYSFGEDNIAVADVSGVGGKTRVILLNKRGKFEKEYNLDERLIDICLYEKSLYLQSLSGFERINIRNGKSYFAEHIASGYDMIPIDKDTLVICNEYYAKFIELKK